MHADSILKIGSSHIICEDYALTGISFNSEPLIVICDGCSSARNTDIGARLLALAFFHNNIQHILEYENLTSEYLAEYIEDKYKEELRILPSMFTCTYLLAYAKGDSINIDVCGDGVVLIQYKNGKRAAIHIDSNNFAFYFSYYFHNTNIINPLYEYREIEDTRIKHYVKHTDKDDYTLADSYTYRLSDVGKIQFSVLKSDVEYVAVMSDGITSFEQNGKPINMLDIIDKLFNFYTTAGEFLKRSFNGLSRFMRKEGITHYDDLSIACLYIGKE